LVPILALALVAGACGDDKKSTTGGGTGTTVAAPTFPAGTTMAALQSKGKIVVGTKFDQPGFGQKNPTNNQVEGFDVEIAKLITAAVFGGAAKDAGSKIEFVESVSKNREPFIQNGTVDIVVATYTIKDSRKQQVDFAGPYFIAAQDMMVKSSDDSIKKVEDLDAKKVCTAKGSTSEANVKAKAPHADVLIFDTYSQCAEALTDGRVVAVTTDAPILNGLVAKSSGAFKVVGNPFSVEPYGIGLKKGDDAFRTFINDQLEKAYADGTWATAFEATLGKLGLTTPQPPPVDRYQSTGPTVTATTVAATTTTTVAGATATTVAATTTTKAATTTTGY